MTNDADFIHFWRTTQSTNLDGSTLHPLRHFSQGSADLGTGDFTSYNGYPGERSCLEIQDMESYFSYISPK